MKTLIRITEWILYKWWLWLLLAILCSCSTVKYVPVETIKNDSIYIAQVEHDSIYVKDSIYIKESADTVYITRWRTEYKEALRVDTVQVVRTDSIQTIVEVERELSKMEELKMNIGSGVLWAIPILIALYILYRKFLK